MHEHLCIKEFNGILSSYVAFMEKTNWALMNSSNLDLILSAFPLLKFSTKVTTHSLKLAIKRLQEAKTLSLLQKFTVLRKKKCPIPLNAFIPPYQLVNRDLSDRAKLRKKKWKFLFFGKKIIKQSLHVAKGTLKIKTFYLQ